MSEPSTDRMDQMLTRLKLTGIRDQLDTLLDEAGRKDLNLRESLAYMLEVEVARKDQRRFAMGLSIEKFPFVRSLDDFDYEAQPSIDEKVIRELSVCRWVANKDATLLLGPPGAGKTHLAVDLFFQLVARRYERGSILITSNRSVGELGAIFDDAVLATAILDRLLFAPARYTSAHRFLA
jgi:DNA replication protein DnaC